MKKKPRLAGGGGGGGGGAAPLAPKRDPRRNVMESWKATRMKFATRKSHPGALISSPNLGDAARRQSRIPGEGAGYGKLGTELSGSGVALQCASENLPILVGIASEPRWLANGAALQCDLTV